MIDPFPTEKAKAYACEVQQAIEACHCIDYEGEGRYSTDTLISSASDQMFGVLVCKDQNGNEVVLKAFSGHYGGKYLIDGWVPPAFDVEAFEDFVEAGDARKEELSAHRDPELLEKMQAVSKDLQMKRLSLYRFHCADGGIRGIEDAFGGELPPEGTGDCCAVKLLNHAFSHHLLPISMFEWHVGTIVGFDGRASGNLHPPNTTRCRPLLAMLLGIDIVYRDQSIIVVNKPSGLLSVPGRGEDKQDCVVSRVKRLFPMCIEQPSVHRLDMDTSGLLVLAFTQEAHRNLSIQFIKRKVHKKYVALLDGVVKEENGKIELAFRYDPEHKPRQKYDPVLGKWGTTLWERVQVEPFGIEGRLVTRVEFEPLTGRTHQLRLHSAHVKGLGCPIVGDPLYGNPDGASRLMLHASEIRFLHPETGEHLHFLEEPGF